jgi:hypothetical protein
MTFDEIILPEQERLAAYLAHSDEWEFSEAHSIYVNGASVPILRNKSGFLPIGSKLFLWKDRGWLFRLSYNGVWFVYLGKALNPEKISIEKTLSGVQITVDYKE